MKLEHSTLFIGDVQKKIVSGQMLPAAFQRPYAWNQDDVESLCDSIISGFPIGTFLLWTPTGKEDISLIAKNRIGPNTIVPEKTDGFRSLLLDGHNRVATIAWLFSAGGANGVDTALLSDNERDLWVDNDEVPVIDVPERRIIFVPKEEAEEGMRLPAWTVSPNLVEVNPFLRKKWSEWEAAGRSEEEIKEALDCHGFCSQAFSNARIGYTNMIGATASEARHAFTRICRTGVPISEFDFAQAEQWTPPTTRARKP